MSAPILARLGRSARLVGQAVRALLPADSAPAGTIVDFSPGMFTQRRESPARVRQILEDASTGSLATQWELFALMEDTWPRLAKNLAELRRAAARATYSVQPCAPRGAAPSAPAVERAALVEASLRGWWPRPGTLELSFEDTLFHVLDAYGKGLSVLELHWQQAEPGLVPRCSHVLAPRRYGWNRAGNELGLLTPDGTGWAPFPADQFLVGIWQARTGAPGATAVLRALAPYWVGITYGWEWLLSNAQLFGVPFRWATFARDQPGLGTQLRDMLAAMGASGYGAFPEGTQLNFLEAARNTGDNPQIWLQRLADQACDLLILGQELSGAAQAAGLGGGAADLQGGVRLDRLQAAAQWCADLLNYQLVPAVLRANYGDTAEAPCIVADVDDEPDPLALATRDKVLLDAGIDLPRAWFYERHGIPLPVAGEPTITGRAPAPAVPPGGAPAFAARQPGLPLRAVRAASAGAGEALFRASAIASLSAAQAEALRPLLTRLAAVAAESDETLPGALAQLRADLPALQRQCLGRTASAGLVTAWENILGTALVAGAATGAQERAAETPAQIEK